MKKIVCLLIAQLMLLGFTANATADPVWEGEWDKIRRYGHGQNRYLFSDEEMAYIDANIAYITLEKVHGSSVYSGGNLDQAAMATAEQLQNTKVFLYLQSFYAFNRWQAVYQADTSDTDLFVPDEGQWPYAFNHGTQAGRSFWASISDDVVNNSKIVGTYVDAIGKITTHGWSEWLPDFYQTLSQLDGMTIINGSPVGNLDYSDGFMREDVVSGTADTRVTNIDYILNQVDKDKHMFLNSFHSDYKFPLAVYLIVSHDNSFFRYFPLAEDLSNNSARWSDVLWHCDEYDYALGAPLADAVKNGYQYSRSFEHVDVWVNVDTEEYVLAWDHIDSDEDGMDDQWEFQHFGDTTSAEASADPDADGLTNLEEYNANSNPNTGLIIDDGISTNLALNGVATQSSTFRTGEAALAIDGNSNGLWKNDSVTHTEEETQPWWQVDLGEDFSIGEIVIYNRTDSCCMERLTNFTVSVINSEGVTTYSQSFNEYPDSSISIDTDNTMGQIVRVQLDEINNLSLAEVEVYEGVYEVSNLALNGSATQSSTDYDGYASRAIDGNSSGRWKNWSVSHTAAEDNAWWQLDLGAQYVLNEIIIYNRTDSCCVYRLSDFEVSVWDADGNLTYSEQFTSAPQPMLSISLDDIAGHIVKISSNLSNTALSLAEVEVYGSIK